MAEQGDFPNSNPLLNGLFGSFQAGASAHSDTASLWADLRRNAATWAWQGSGGGELPSEAELQAQGSQILSEQGIGPMQVNTYRKAAGEWLRAKDNAASAPQDQQIGRESIFQPPWATTANSPIPDRYRIRVQWEMHNEEGESFMRFGTYELQGPLTSIEDALQTATDLVGKKPGSDSGGGAYGPFVNDYEIEQI